MPLVTYSALRLGLLAVCFALGYWAGLRWWLLLIVATFVAWGLSYVLLGHFREAAALYLAERAALRATGAHRFPAVAESDAALEDALDDAARASALAAVLPDDRPGTAPDVAPELATDVATDVGPRPGTTPDVGGDPHRPWQERP